MLHQLTIGIRHNNSVEATLGSLVANNSFPALVTLPMIFILDQLLHRVA